MKLKQVRVSGYKNLIDCKVDLGDFNVIVGPNNSGKSNFLELSVMFYATCYCPAEMRAMALSSLPIRSIGTSIPHLKGYDTGKMTLGFTIETKVKKNVWIVNYDLEFQRDIKDEKKWKFLTERLTAKKSSSTGKAKTYISRKGKEFRIIKKKKAISENVSVLQVIENIYPEYKGLPEELAMSWTAMARVSLNHTLALSPEGLRNSLGEKDKAVAGRQVSNFDINLVIESIAKKEKDFALFKDAVVDILDLEDIKLATRETQFTDEDGKKIIEEQGVCMIKNRGSEYKRLEEYSDGTFNVIAILAHLISNESFGPLLSIEELENCLHPAALKKLIHFLRDNAKRWPVLITTHSPYVLNEVNPADVIVAVTDETGATHFEKLKDRRTINAILNNKYMSFGDFLPGNFEELIGSK